MAFYFAQAGKSHKSLGQGISEVWKVSLRSIEKPDSAMTSRSKQDKQSSKDNAGIHQLNGLPAPSCH